jgi:hypothetical protein
VIRVALAFATACAASANVGVVQHDTLAGVGGTGEAHLGLGGVMKPIAVVDVGTRVDVAPGGSRWTIGTSVLGGLPIAHGFRALARAGVWRAIVSSADERIVVPSFELAVSIPVRELPMEPPSKYGWNASGIVVGVREDLDVIAYTTLFVGYQLLFVPGY